MDWNNIKKIALETKDRAIELWKKWFVEWKKYSEKAIEFSKDKIDNAPVFLKTKEDFEKVKNDKKLIIFFLKEDEVESKKLKLQMPVIITKWWINSTTIRFCFEGESGDLFKELDVISAPEMFIYKQWNLDKKITDISEIRQFLKDFVI
ncbi:MAG: hypothetical protein ACD_49C00050G0026 [uncultured bacterium (gcode 4)]|uniref:Thioredoxin domain-containing protein n=1 Tax=uncultured bacterium (gcode 4) TaxID=1234023 RepID=K2AX87_9BACT|nr:MAG: hypothetical protein ACD_49C00050G0026 [uncultured bacterium (gcode 4)]